MPSIERIKNEGLTPEQVLESETVGPETAPTQVYWPAYWDECPKEQPGDPGTCELLDADGDSPTLRWEDGDFTVHLHCNGFGDWEAHIDVPHTVGSYLVDEHRLKAHHPVMFGDHPVGYVDQAEIDDYAAQTLTVRIAEAEGMPTVELRSYIESLRESANESEAYATDIQEKLDAAKEHRDNE